MRKEKVARISRAVLKWLIPARRGRFYEERTGRNLDLLPCAGYRARGMSERRTRPHSAHKLTPLTKNVHGVCYACDFPSQVNASRRDLIIDRKSTRLNSSHSQISYAVFC